MSEELTKSYKISADYKKSTYQGEYWTNQLKNGKNVELLVTTYFRWGTFTINLTDIQKEEILKRESIILNEYDCDFQEMWDGDSQYIEIENESQYSEEELAEINDKIYEDEDESYDEEYLENNGWCLDDTIYGFSTGCVLESIDKS